MSDERIAKLEQSLLTLRKLLNQRSHEQQDAESRLRHALVACVVAGAMVALTATTWRVEDSEGLEADDVQTLWGMLPDGWPPAVTLGLVLVLGIATVGVSLNERAGPTSHRVVAVLALLTAVMVLFAGNVAPEFGVDADDYETGPGRWLTLLCALVLAGLHGARQSAIR